MEWEQDISMFDWFFTPNNTSSKVIAITIGTIKYCYNIFHFIPINKSINWFIEWNKIKESLLFFCFVEWDEEMFDLWAASSIEFKEFKLRSVWLYVFIPTPSIISSLSFHFNPLISRIKLISLNHSKGINSIPH